VADKDLDELAKAATKAAFATAALTAAQLAMKKVTDRAASTIGAFDKQVAKAASDVDDLASKVETFNKEAAKAADNARQMADMFGGLLDKLAPLSAVLKDVGDRLQVTAVSISQSSTAINIHNQALVQLQAASVDAANGQGAVSEALGKTESAADKSSEKLKKVQETAKELGSSMIDAITALASGEEPMKVLTDKGGEMAKTMLKAKVDGVSLVETFKSLGLATGILQVATTSAAAAQDVNAVSAGAATAALEAQTVAAGELAVAESVALAPLGVILAGIAVAAAGVAAVFAVAAHDIGEKAGDLTKDMGLTEEQMGRVKDKSVTMGDVAKATFEVLGERLKAAFGPGLKAIGDGFMSAYHTVTDVSLKAAAFAVGVFAGAVQAIRVAWSVLPAAMGDIIISGVNLVLDGVGKMVNGAIGMANGLIGTVNWLAKKLGLSLALPDLGQIQVAKLANQFAGAAKSAGSAISAAFGNGFTGGFDGIMNIPAVVAGRAVKIAKERIQDEAGKISAAPTSAAGARDIEAGVRKSSEAMPRREDPERYEQLEAFKLPDVEKLTTVPEVNLEAYNKQREALASIMDAYDQINKLAPQLGQSFESAFGKSGKALSAFVGSWSSFAKKMADIRDSEVVDGRNSKELDEQRAKATVEGYADMAAAAKGFFDQNSSGYAALQAVEKAYRLWQFAMNVKEMAQEATKTTTSIANSFARATASAAAGAGKIFETMGPFGFPVVAAMMALLAGLGLKGGGGGGGSVPGANDMKTRQETQGSGSVLGDSKAKSESLEKALTHAQAYENKDLEYGNAMVRSLKSIDDQIGAVASALAKSFGAGGMLSTEGLNLGKTGTSATLSNLGFSKSTTRTLQDQGIQFDAATLGDIADGGLSGSTYQQILETTKRKALFMPSSSKSRVITQTGALDSDFVDQVTKLIGLLGKGVTDAATALKETGVEELLKSFKVDLGKLSFKDMTGTQIEEALNAIFGKLGDDMAKAAVPAIAQFQKVGEGAFETLVRVARQYEVIDTTLKSVGMTFGMVGVASLEARERLVDLVGGLDNLTDQTAFFAEHFLSEEERLKPVKDTVRDKLTELKLPADMTRDDFTALVLKQDVSTQAGAELYAALMALAPAFDKVATAAEGTKSAIDDRMVSIQDRIDEMTLTSAQLTEKQRAKEMKAAQGLGQSVADLLQKQYDLEDAQTRQAAAAEAATKAADDAARAQEAHASAMQSLGNAIVGAMKRAEELAASLRSLADELLGQMGGAGEQLSYGVAKANLVAGAQDGEKLEGLIRSFLDVSKRTSSSTSAYQADVAWARGLALAEADRQAARPEALVNFWHAINTTGFATGGSFEVGGSGAPDSKLFNLALSPGEMVNVRRPGAANDNGSDGLVGEIRALREELAELRRTAGSIDRNTSKMESTLTNVTEGGRAMLTEAAS